MILNGTILDADINNSAAIAYSKLSLGTSIVNADISNSAAIAYSKLNLATSIVNNDIAAGAAIVDTKLATISTAGKVANSATTATKNNTADSIVQRDVYGNLFSEVLTSPMETFATRGAMTGTVNYDVLTQAVLYANVNATGNWTLNVRGNGSTTLNSIMSTGQSLTIAFLATNSTAYYQSGFQVDGSAVTPKWQGGTAPSAGNASSTDIYTFTIVKTAATPTYTVFGAGPIKYA
jgi:hypothetical protein